MALSARNNLKSIRTWMKRICVWIAMKRNEYVDNLTPTQVTAIDNVVIACEALIAVIDEIYPPNL